MTKKRKILRRKHDPFFRYIYAIPANTRSLLRLAKRKNPELRKMLSTVDMDSLELIPGSFSNVKEWGESDLAFKARIKGGPEIFVGILLEHKSYLKKDVLSQIYRYTFEVMQNKGATDFGWLPTKAIIIYNGRSDWDPMAEFRTKYRGQFNGRELPFECVLVNLADIPDEACLREPNVEAAVGALVMKHAFDADGLRSVVGGLTKMLSRLENGARATLAEKIVVYLGEYLDEEVVEELRMRMSIGQALGIKTAGDRLRAAERAADRRGRKRGLAQGLEQGVKQGAEKERERNEALNLRRVKFLRSQNVPDSVISAMLAIK
ncbi:Rpn family recombination-promoting nuclease/putative transposase [Fibrobacter sp. UWH4]|uniref:Rpn family recombination-promoting nuclease/putative transposase n=1 Tax=Fibrobacter sp. UWH4 TaxID=1896210 RepID=UPI00158746D3|nr:Rpn family recombination-promoting nuclease/putative transposase [Fibrobacter sp. UWH4]